MRWIAVDVGIGEDEAICSLADRLDLSVPCAVGHVVLLERQLPRHARDGVITRISDGTLERWASWTGPKGQFAAAYRELLCLERDGDTVVASWEDTNGAAIRRADRDAERKRSKRNGDGQEPEAPRSAPRKPRDKPPMSGGHPADIPAEVLPTSGRDVTGRDTTLPSSPDGSEAPSPDRPAPGAGGAPDNRGLFAEWEAALLAVALPHEAAAFEHVASQTFRPAVVGELYAIASGQHVIRGEYAPYREAGIADVMQALSEFVILNRPWNQSYFRGCVRRVLNRPPEPPTAEERERARQASAVRAAGITFADADTRTDEQKAADAERRRQAMEHFRREFHANRGAEARTIPTLAGAAA